MKNSQEMLFSSVASCIDTHWKRTEIWLSNHTHIYQSHLRKVPLWTNSKSCITNIVKHIMSNQMNYCLAKFKSIEKQTFPKKKLNKIFFLICFSRVSGEDNKTKGLNLSSFNIPEGQCSILGKILTHDSIFTSIHLNDCNLSTDG